MFLNRNNDSKKRRVNDMYFVLRFQKISVFLTGASNFRVEAIMKHAVC